jgi:hypothetical protein
VVVQEHRFASQTQQQRHRDAVNVAAHTGIDHRHFVIEWRVRRIHDWIQRQVAQGQHRRVVAWKNRLHRDYERWHTLALIYVAAVGAGLRAEQFEAALCDACIDMGAALVDRR